MMRTEQVSNIKQWYECGTGKMMVEKYLPKQAEAIAANYAVPQMDNEKKLAGVYHFDFTQEDKQITAYVGESGNIYWRLLEHFYNLVNGVTSWGVPVTEILKKNITIEWYGMTGIVDKELREEVEAVHIKAWEPFLQYTANTDPE